VVVRHSLRSSCKCRASTVTELIVVVITQAQIDMLYIARVEIAVILRIIPRSVSTSSSAAILLTVLVLVDLAAPVVVIL
jgi:hypothetical protein